MKIFILVSFCLILFLNGVCQQQTSVPSKAVKLTENSIVKDSSGNVYPAAIWRKLLATGRYSLKTENANDNNSTFILVRLSDEQFSKRLETIPKPKESTSFTTGKKFQSIKTRDINGNKINTKNLVGKIIVINFWFIKCPPCIMEIPELNKLTEEYKQDSAVVFLAVALDDQASLSDFLYSTPFKYTIIGDGKMIAADYNIRSYPTNLVVSPEGNVYFHAAGYSGIATTHWIKKSIDELKSKMLSTEAAPTATE